MKKLLTIFGNKIIWHGEEVKDDFSVHSTKANDHSEENYLEDIDLREDPDAVRPLEDLDNVPMLQIENSNIEALENNSSKRKNQVFVIQVGKLVESGIISMEERDKLVECAKKIFKS